MAAKRSSVQTANLIAKPGWDIAEKGNFEFWTGNGQTYVGLTRSRVLNEIITGTEERAIVARFEPGTNDYAARNDNFKFQRGGLDLVRLNDNIDLHRCNVLEARFLRAFLIQLYGHTRNNTCTYCAGRITVFYRCRTIPDEYRNCCGECKRIDRCHECSLGASASEETKLEQKVLEEAQAAQQTQVIKTRSGRTTTVPATYSV